MKIAITGGTGFVGRHVATRLRAEGHVVVCQVRIFAEGIVEPLPAADGLPVDLLPTTRFDEASIRSGLPDPGGFGRRDLRWCAR